MGFSEYDRIRSKNKKYNFPTTKVNQQARNLIESFYKEGFSKKESLHYLNIMYSHPHKDIPEVVIKTAKTILERYE